MLKVVCFKWDYTGGIKLPGTVKYTAEHVNRLQSMVKRHLHIPHEFICITDNPTGIKCRTIPLWDKCRDLGGCFNRLYVFSYDMKHIIGDRFVCIDLDCVIVDDVTPLFDRPDNFIINSYNPLPTDRNAPDQYYNGGMFMMTAGSMPHVWDEFCPKSSPKVVQANNRRGLSIGTDQAWIRHILGKSAKRWTVADGVTEARFIRGEVPKGARMIFFAGNRDPSTTQWARKYW